MTERKQQVQVGILFIVSLVVLIWGVLWFKEFKIGGSTYQLVAEFPSTSGLLKGDPVEVKGVPSGKVAEIKFENGSALVVLQLNNHVPLYESSRVAIENVGLMGQKVVAIYPGPEEGDPLPPGTIIKGVYSAGIPQIMGNLGGTLATFERLALRVDSLLVTFDRPKQEQVNRTLTNIERVTGELAGLLETNREDLTASIQGMREVMTDLHEMLDGRGDQFGQVLDDASTAAARLDSTLTTLDHTVGKVDALLTKVDRGEGTLGKVAQDEELYDELVITLRDAKELLNDIRANPRRYFKVSVF